MLKLPRVLTGPQVTATNDRLRAHGRPDEQHAAAEGPDAEGHADAARRKDALTLDRHDDEKGGARTIGPGRPPSCVRSFASSASDPDLRRRGPARSCSPRPSRSQIRAGTARHSSTLRTQRPGTTPSRPPSSATTRRPRSRLPGVKPTVPTVSTLITRKTPQRPVPGRLPVTAGDQPVCDQDAQRPVDDEGAEAPPERGDGARPCLRQTQPLAPVSEVDAHVLGGRAGPGEPRSDCLPVVHPSTVLRPRFTPSARVPLSGLLRPPPGSSRVPRVPRCSECKYKRKKRSNTI